MSKTRRNRPSGHIGQDEYIRAVKKASREQEIERFGKQVTTLGGRRMHRSPKDFKRCKRVEIEEEY